MGRNKRRRWIIGGAIVALLLLIVFWFPGQMAREKLPYASQNAKNLGAKALALLLEKRGMNVAKWDNDYPSLPSNTAPSTLLTIEPMTEPPSSDERQALLEWVEQGNQWILFASPETTWPETFGFDVTTCKEESTQGLIAVRKTPYSNRWLREIQAMRWEGACARPAKQDRTLLTSFEWDALVVMRTKGKGRIIFVPYARIITNEYIDRADHLALPLGLLEGYSRNVWFDETVHPWLPRLDQRSTPIEPPPEDAGEKMQGPSVASFFALLRINGWYLFLQILMAVIYWLWLKGKRFGPPRRDPKREWRSGSEYVIAMSRWLNKKRSRKKALLLLFDRFQDELKEALRLPAADEKRLLENMEKKFGSSFRQRFEEIANQMNHLERSSKTCTKPVFIALAKALFELRKEMNQWKPKRPTSNVFNAYRKRSSKP